MTYFFKKVIRQNAEGVEPTTERAAERETSPFGYHSRFFTILGDCGFDFENILQTQNEEQLNKGGLIYAESSRSKLKCCMYRAAYTITVLKKSGW